jgi:hypothetical protein
MNKAIGLIILLIITNIVVYSQPKNIGLYISLTRNYRTLNKNYSSLNKVDEKSNLFNCGISYEKNILKRLTVLTGLDYSMEGYNRNPVYLIGSYLYTTNFRLNYIGIPMELNYYFISSNKIKLGLYMGINAKYLIFAKYIPDNIEKISTPSSQFPSQTLPGTETFFLSKLKENEYSLFNIDALGGLRLCYSINKISLGISPEIRYAMISTTKHATYYHTPNEYLFSYGVKFIIFKN